MPRIPCWRRQWAPGSFLPYRAPWGTHAKCLLSPSTKKYQVTGIVHFTISIRSGDMRCLSYFQWELEEFLEVLEGLWNTQQKEASQPTVCGAGTHIPRSGLIHRPLRLTGKFTRKDLRTTSWTLGCVASCLWETNNIYIWLVGRQSYDSAIILDRRRKLKKVNKVPASNSGVSKHSQTLNLTHSMIWTWI